MQFLAATLIRQLLTTSDFNADMMEQIKVMLVKWMDRDIQDRCFMLLLADIAKFVTQFQTDIPNLRLFAQKIEQENNQILLEYLLILLNQTDTSTVSTELEVRNLSVQIIEKILQLQSLDCKLQGFKFLIKCFQFRSSSPQYQPQSLVPLINRIIAQACAQGDEIALENIIE